jgi:hypothetical protein
MYPGQIVCLKNYPNVSLCIIAVSKENQHVKCQWLTSLNEYQEAWFHIDNINTNL